MRFTGKTQNRHRQVVIDLWVASLFSHTATALQGLFVKTQVNVLLRYFSFSDGFTMYVCTFTNIEYNLYAPFYVCSSQYGDITDLPSESPQSVISRDERASHHATVSSLGLRNASRDRI